MERKLVDQRIIYFIILSVALHFIVMWTHHRESRTPIVTTTDRFQEIKVLPMTSEEWKEKVNKRKQIIQAQDTDDSSKPNKEAFLSDKDRSVERETMARHIDIFHEGGRGDGKIDQEKQVKTQTQNSKKKISFSDLGMGSPAENWKKNNEQQAEKTLSLAGAKNASPDRRGISSTNDYVEHAKLGDFTQMNTVEFKYYGFYHRIRQKLEQFWGRSIHAKAEVLFKQGRRLPANENLTTSLVVKLNAKGEITKVLIRGSSGVRELDDAAIESFNEAGPFPNPPKDLLVNGEAVIEWGFVVQS